MDNGKTKQLFALIPEMEINLSNFSQENSEIAAILLDKFEDYFVQCELLIVFDWSNWITTIQSEIDDSKTDFDNYSFETLCKIGTSIIRGERFNENLILTYYLKGVLLKILKSLEKKLK